ncbi:MAG: tryptophan--tRNA ligase, partial [Dehalococcoidales bacterium]|nr:tryptophan--tRNA ligase [Dehalococcoidales bacterium]
SLREIRFDESRPGIFNLLTIYHLFSGQAQKEIEAQFEGKGYGDFKKAVAEAVVEVLRPVQERYAELTAEPGRIESIFAAGAEKAQPIAMETLKLVRQKIGLE